MATSRVGAAIDALVAVLRAAPALEGVTVVDGPAVTNVTERRRLYVGWSPTADQAAEIAQDFASAGARRRDEDFSINCYAETRSGDKDMALRRTAVFDLLAAVEVALRATDAQPEAPTLGGTVLWAHVSAGALVQEQNPDGAMAMIPFTVTCRARL